MAATFYIVKAPTFYLVQGIGFYLVKAKGIRFRVPLLCFVGFYNKKACPLGRAFVFHCRKSQKERDSNLKLHFCTIVEKYGEADRPKRSTGKNNYHLREE